MLSLHETQERFARGILGGADADKLIVADWLQPEQRLAIYRHHYHATLREALALSFPVVMRLVGEGFFKLLADAFTAQHPPSHPCLAEYGAAFPDFIAGFDAANALPYLADVALFEWLMDEAAQTPDYKGNAFYSPWPVGRIWETNQADYRGDDVVSLNDGGGWFVVERNEDGVIWRVLNLPPNAFQKFGEEERS